MNKVYRIVFNQALGLLQVVSELASGHGKSSATVNQNAAMNEWTSLPYRISSLRLATLLALGFGLNVGLTQSASAATCGPTSVNYTYCFVGGDESGIGHWNQANVWLNQSGSLSSTTPAFAATDIALVSGPNTVLNIIERFKRSTGVVADANTKLVIENGARLKYQMPKVGSSSTGTIFRGSITLNGTEESLSTLELNTILNGKLREGTNSVLLGDYSQLTLSNTLDDTPSAINEQTVFTNGGLILAGQNIYFNALNNSQLGFKTNFFNTNQLLAGNDATIVDGNATRVMNLNLGDKDAENSDGSVGNGRISILGTNKSHIGQWNIFGGTLRITDQQSLGLTPSTSQNRPGMSFDIDAALGDDYGLSYDGKNLGVLEIEGASTEFSHDFETKNNGTLIKIDSLTDNNNAVHIFNGEFNGNGGVIFGGASSIEKTVKYELAGDQNYKGTTYVGVNTTVDYQSDGGTKNLTGDILISAGSTIQFSGDNSFLGDVYYDTNNTLSQTIREGDGFNFDQMAYIRFGSRELAVTSPTSKVDMYGYTDKDLMMDVLNSTLTLHSGYAGNNKDLPFTKDMLENLDLTNQYDGVYGAKLLDIYGDGNKKYVSTQANFILSEFDHIADSGKSMWAISSEEDLAKLGLTSTNGDSPSTAQEWQEVINQLAKENPDGLGSGSTIILNQDSIIGAPGVNDPLEDEVIFNGRFLPSTKDISNGGQTNTLTDNTEAGITSKLIKEGDGRTVIINPNLTLSDIVDLETDLLVPFQQQLNVHVKEGTLDWRVDVPFDRNSQSYNPNVMVVQGNYQTDAGAMTSISNAATFLRIQKQAINFSLVGSPDGIYIPGSGDFILAGVDNPGADYDSNLDSQRATLNIIAGGGELAEVYAEGKVDIRGALLFVTGVSSTQDPDTVLKSSELIDSAFTLIHASDGFVGGDFVADEDGTKDNTLAVFANNQRPAAFVDFLTGGEGLIVNCNFDIDPSIGCLIDKDSVGAAGQDESLNAQEYVLRGLELSWNHTGDLPSITGDFTIEPRSESFEVDTVLADRGDLDPKRNQDGLFESDYGLWDGKTLTKKGQGLLVLSADNTYTGETNINAGRLRITRDRNLGALATGKLNLGNGLTSFGSTLEIAGTEFDTQGGSSRDLVLGRSDYNKIDVIDADNTATFTGNITNSTRFATARWYLPNGELVADQSAPPAEAMKGLWADVDGNLVDQDTPPSGSILRFERKSTIIKEGEGHLVLAPDQSNSDPANHNIMDYDGDTEVIEGKLTFKGDTSQLEGNLYNLGIVTFDQAEDSTFLGNISEKKFRATADTPIVALNTPFVATVFKDGVGALTLVGKSELNWEVNGGGLITEASRFLGDIKLNADTFLTFDQSAVSPLGGSPLSNAFARANNIAEYSGIIIGDANSTFNVVGNGALRFDSNTQSTLGNVVIGDGTSNTMFYVSNNDATSEKALTVQTDFTVKSGSTTILENTNSYLDVGGKFTQEVDSVLNVMLNLNNNTLGKADISASEISLAGSINVLGFQRVNGCEEAVDEDTCDVDIASRFVKASELDEVNYTLMESDTEIDISALSRNLAGYVDPSKTHPLDASLPSYLVYFFSTSDAPNEAGKYTFDIDNINLAWNFGDAERANGTFDIVGDSGFEVDVVLKDRSGEIFATGNTWDGATLTKTGTGELKLSAENEYTGDTIIEEGTLTISNNGNLGANTPTSSIIIGDKDSTGNATLKIDTAPTKPEIINLNRNIVLGERNDNTIEIVQGNDSVVIQGKVTGTENSGLIKSGAGNLTLDGGFDFGGANTDTVITDGTLTLNFKTNDDAIGGDILNAGKLVVDVATGVESTITGNVSGNNDVNGTVDKTGAGNITLAGSNELDWLVKNGGLLTSADSFLGNITLDNNTFLTFLLNQNKVGNYQGKLTGATNSTLNVVNQGELDFYYDNGSTVGNVVVGNGTDVSILNLKNNTTGTTPNPFEVGGNFTTKSGSITNLIGSDTYLNVAETFTQESGANLGVTLDLNNPNADITAKNVNLDGSLTVLGFTRILCEQSTTNCNNGYRIVTASESEAIYYKLIESQNVINGEFIGDASVTHPLDLRQGGYLFFEDKFSEDGKIYYIDSLKLAWIHGDDENSTGTFDLADDLAFDVDYVLEDRTPDIAFDTGWDGKTLEKTGGGELILSKDNTYTGDTIIDEGTLTVSNDKNLGNNDPNFGVGNIQLGNSDPDQGNATLNITGNDPFVTGRDINLGNRDDNTINVESPDNSATINGQITGDGSDSGLVKDGDGELILTNGGNDYTGKTEIVDGSLTLKNDDNVLDDSSDIIIDNGGNLNIGDGTDQTLNNLQNGNPAKPGTPPTITVELPGGELTLSNDKDTEFSGSIKGEIDLVIQGKPKNPADPTLPDGPNGSLTLDGDLTEFVGDTSIKEGGTLIIDGSKNPSTGGKNGNITTNITGEGTNDDNTLEITNGGTVTGSINDLGEVKIDDSSNWNITDDSSVGTLDLTGGGSATFTDPSDPTWDGRDLVIDNLINDGKGKIVIRTELGGDDSKTDKIILKNEPVGKTIIEVKNKGGKGDVTTDGIKIVDADTNGVDTADDAFELEGGRVVSVDNLFNYYLKQGKLDGTSDDWFLRSEKNEGYRQEVDIARNFSAISNQIGLLTLGTYHDRVGANTSTMYHKELQPHTPWIRILGETGDVDNGSGTNSQLAYGANYDYDIKGIQLGLDFYENTDEDGVRDVAGIYLSYANSDNDLKGVQQQNIGTTSLDSTSGGIYYTRSNQHGAYFDAVGQYSRYSSLKGSSNFGQNFSTKGWGALVSGEVGYPWHIDENWKVEPQAQLIYQHIKLDASQDEFSRFSPDADNSFTGRLGARLAHHDLTDEGRPIDSFIRFNYWKTFDFDSKMVVSDLDGQNPIGIETQQGGSKLQFGLGLAYEPEIDWQLFLGVDYNRQIEGASGDSISGHLGVKYAF